MGGRCERGSVPSLVRTQERLGKYSKTFFICLENEQAAYQFREGEENGRSHHPSELADKEGSLFQFHSNC